MKMNMNSNIVVHAGRSGAGRGLRVAMRRCPARIVDLEPNDNYKIPRTWLDRADS